ncbi:MAG: CHC2 zinc finger domain-containing protein [Candidatus Paceibacterota bacterium]
MPKINFSSYYEKVCEKVDWLNVLKKLGIKIGKRKKGALTNEKDLIILCPIHRENNPSMHFSSETGMFHCFGCGRTGNIFDFVSELVFKGNRKKTFYWMRKNFGISLPWEK